MYTDTCVNICVYVCVKSNLIKMFKLHNHNIVYINEKDVIKMNFYFFKYTIIS